MFHQVEAVYEHGVLRPLQPLLLTERQHVCLTIFDNNAAIPPARMDMAAVERARAVSSTLGSPPSIEQVRAALASIPGSLSHDVIAERGDY